MTVVAVACDCTTTTCVALAAAWYAGDEVIILEADPSGGSLAGWLDTPSSPSLASAVAATTAANRSAADTIDSVVQRSRSGLRFIAAPVRSLPASPAIAAAQRSSRSCPSGETWWCSPISVGQPASGHPSWTRPR
jgi:MinD-like ATPase involved in chromosome partitioning or flagellar assembly